MKEFPYELWEPVIGFEVHVQLNTKSKLFSSSANHFGDEPNTNISEFCTGQPGTLPILNKEAVHKAILFGLAINATINRISTFDRKSYFYPDNPRNFQITQYENPIITGGTIVADIEGNTKEFLIDHAHLEDDAGMLKHFNTFAGIDYNRAGTPLIEIVTKPMINTPKEGVAFLTALKAIMEYIDVSDCNMEKGHLRVDVNISCRPRGEKTLRPRCEFKNMNSFNQVEHLIETEIRRQIALYTAHPEESYEKIISPGTYRWDWQQKKIRLMRKKETEDDYRYFPEPDLVPLVISRQTVESIKKKLPELPHDRFKRYITTLHLTPYAASQLINDKNLADFFEEALTKCSNPISLCNWITVEFTGRLKELGHTLFSLNISPFHIAKLVNMIEERIITGKIAKKVADKMIENPLLDPEEIVNQNPDFQPIHDEEKLESIVDTVLKENPQSIEDYKKGKTRAFSFLVGQVMQRTKGKSSPEVVNKLIRKKIES